jgi:hypothetical protein
MTMNRNVVEMPAERLRLPQFVEYHGRVYRAWTRLPAAELSGFVLTAEDTNGQKRALIYANPGATVLVVVA